MSKTVPHMGPAGRDAACDNFAARSQGGQHLECIGSGQPATYILAMNTTTADSRIELALQASSEAQARAYAPYSRFAMGAAVVTAGGITVPGALVENISFGLTMCAERAALFAAVARDAGTPEVLALTAPETGGELTWPCGACLQVAMELGGPGLIVAVSNGRGKRATATLADLAPKIPFKPPRS